MIFKYNRYDINEKNLYYLSMVSMLNYGIIVNLFFVIGAIVLVLQEENINIMTISYAMIIVMFGISIFGIDAIYRMVILKRRISLINRTLNVDVFSSLKGKKLDKNLVYKDDEWFIAVPSPECIIVNRKYIEKDIVIKNKAKSMDLSIRTINGKLLEYQLDDKWKYTVEQLKKWIKNNG